MCVSSAYREIARQWSEVPGRFKDFVTRPKPNGYQSLHTNLRLPDGRGFELQIRTASMHEKAERGSAAHNAYRARQLEGGAATRMLPPAASSSTGAEEAAEAAEVLVEAWPEPLEVPDAEPEAEVEAPHELPAGETPVVMGPLEPRVGWGGES